MMAETLLDGQSEALVQKAVEIALEGDTVALRLCLERILPPRKDRPIRLTLPPIQSAQDTVTAMSRIIEAATTGQIDPHQAQNLAALIETQRKAVETLDLESRITELEQQAQPDKFGSLLDVAWFTIVTGTTVGYGDVSPSTFFGKIFVGLMLVPIIGSIGMAISAFSNACDTVQDLEDDPNVDPLEEWTKERERIRERRKLNSKYKMAE